MKQEINWNTYQAAWKNEASFKDEKLKKEDIQLYMNSSSRSLVSQFRKSIMLDIGLKTLLLMAAIIPFFTFDLQTKLFFILVTLSVLMLAGIIHQFMVLHKIPDGMLTDANIQEWLNRLCTFYNKHFVKSLLNSACSSPLFFIVGSMHYLQFKYGGLRPLHLDDFIVLGLGIILSFSLSAITQIKNGNRSIHEIESSLEAIKNDEFKAIDLLFIRNKRRKNILIVSLAFISGLLLFIWLVSRY